MRGKRPLFFRCKDRTIEKWKDQRETEEDYTTVAQRFPFMHFILRMCAVLC